MAQQQTQINTYTVDSDSDNQVSVSESSNQRSRSRSTSDDLCGSQTQSVCWTCARALASPAEHRFHQATHATRKCPVCDRSVKGTAANVSDHWRTCGLPAQAPAVPAARAKAVADVAIGCDDPKLAMRCTVHLVDCRKRKWCVIDDDDVVLCELQRK